MSTDIGLQNTTFQVGDRRWLKSPHGTDYTPGVTLDVSKFVAGTHYPNGYIPSGTVVGIVTASGKAGPYTTAGSDGTETAVGITFGDVTVVRQNGTSATAVGTGILVHGIVSVANLPFQTGAGSVDAAGKADLPLIRFEA